MFFLCPMHVSVYFMLCDYDFKSSIIFVVKWQNMFHSIYLKDDYIFFRADYVNVLFM